MQKLTPDTPIFKDQKQLINWVKKRQKGKGSFVHMNYDCGDIEYNNQIFNSSVDSNSGFSNSNSGLITDGASTGMGESLQLISENNGNKNQISSRVKSLIQGEKEIIENGWWEELSDKFCKYRFHNEHIAEFYQIMENSNIKIPQEIKEIILISRLNKLIAKLRGNPDRYNTFFAWMNDEGIYSTLEILWEHTYNFSEEEFKNILFKYKDKLIIPIEELKF